MNKIVIRKGTSNDAEEKGYVHYKTWIETYTGHFPDEVIKGQTLERCVRIAREHPENTYIALINDKVVGFASYLVARDKDLINYGEIMAIYILKEFQGLGIGKKLMQPCYEELSIFRGLLIWVLKSNKKAISFYESEDFKIDGVSSFLYGAEAIRMIKKKKNKIKKS